MNPSQAGDTPGLPSRRPFLTRACGGRSPGGGAEGTESSLWTLRNFESENLQRGVKGRSPWERSDLPNLLTTTRLHVFRRGSSASLSQSPTRLIDSTVNTMANPGKRESHQALST